MIHAYLICEPATAAPLPKRRGLRGAKLRATTAEGLAAVYSSHRSFGASPELVLAHERVIEAVMERGPVLPLRFGTRLEHERDLVAFMGARRAELLAAIDRVRGRVEMGLRVIPRVRRGGQRDETSSGRAYLLERVEKHRLSERAKREVHLPLTRLATADVVATRVTPPAILAASYLVPADRVENFRTAAGRLAAGVAEVQSFVTGPWPPYSFVALDETSAASAASGHPG
ncbi:MAG: GvpL/GvpF family gas vesicle protein [Solirubrobacterales bacterium]|nr:GvpL/GvpF family gas vesicle protein [Solirubrobacterales bacterium]